MKVKVAFIVVLIFLFSSSNIFAKSYYKWVDENGTTHYTDDESTVPMGKLEQAEYTLPPLSVISKTPLLSLGAKNVFLEEQKKNYTLNYSPSLRKIRALKSSIDFFQNEIGKYDALTDKWSASRLKWKKMKESVLQTTIRKQSLLHDLHYINDSPTLKAVEIYLDTSIKNDYDTAKWKNWKKKLVEYDLVVDAIDPDTGQVVVDPFTDEVETKTIKVKKFKMSADEMKKDLARRLRDEEAQQAIILPILESELALLENP